MGQIISIGRHNQCDDGPQVMGSFFMGLLIRLDSTEWAKKFQAFDDVATLMEPREEMILVPCQQEKETTNSHVKRKH